MVKKLPYVILLVHLSLSLASAQPVDTLLNKADSLFARQDFTQSFDLYDSIYNYRHEASPAMLLKMAYIKEGLNDITSAQYYLNEYYLATSNELALQKMEDLAVANNLEGYQHNDITFFFNIYYKNYNWLVIGLILICGIFLALVIFQKRRYRTTPWTNIFFLVCFLAGLFVLVNFGRDYNRGVIMKNNTFVMAAPSAGADIIDVVGKGNKVIVEGKKDVWYRIEWNDHKAYVKANNVKLLTIW